MLYAYVSMHVQVTEEYISLFLRLSSKTLFSPPWPRNDAAQHTYLWSGHPRQGLLVVNFLVSHSPKVRDLSLR